MKKNIEKTNVMRILDQKKIQYIYYEYECVEAISGIEVADKLKKEYDMVFKTLVTIGFSRTYYVFMIPVNKELDLKKAAKAVNEKSISMIKSKDLLSLTGYIHGGCSPIGMKKQFFTIIDVSVKNLSSIIFSAGKIGFQIELSLIDLSKLIKFSLFDITE